MTDILENKKRNFSTCSDLERKGGQAERNKKGGKVHSGEPARGWMTTSHRNNQLTTDTWQILRDGAGAQVWTEPPMHLFKLWI